MSCETLPTAEAPVRDHQGFVELASQIIKGHPEAYSYQLFDDTRASSVSLGLVSLIQLTTGTGENEKISYQVAASDRNVLTVYRIGDELQTKTQEAIRVPESPIDPAQKSLEPSDYEELGKLLSPLERSPPTARAVGNTALVVDIR